MKTLHPWMPGVADIEVHLNSTGQAVLTHYTPRYHEWGPSTGQPIVLVPGLAGGLGLITPLASALADIGLRVLAYDLRGEGDCFALRRRFDLADLAADLGEFLDFAGLERPLVLGVSFGGLVAMHYAARRPRRLAGVVVQGIAACWENSLFQQIAAHVLQKVPLPTNNPFVNQFFNLFHGRRPQDNQVAELIVRLCWQTDQSVMAYRFGLAQHCDLRSLLPRVTTPALVLWGDRDIVVSDQAHRQLVAGLPRAEAKTLPGAGHLACITHVATIAPLVQRFAQQTLLNA